MTDDVFETDQRIIQKALEAFAPAQSAIDALEKANKSLQSAKQKASDAKAAVPAASVHAFRELAEVVRGLNEPLSAERIAAIAGTVAERAAPNSARTQAARKSDIAKVLREADHVEPLLKELETAQANYSFNIRTELLKGLTRCAREGADVQPEKIGQQLVQEIVERSTPKPKTVVEKMLSNASKLLDEWAPSSTDKGRDLVGQLTDALQGMRALEAEYAAETSDEPEYPEVEEAPAETPVVTEAPKKQRSHKPKPKEATKVEGDTIPEGAVFGGLFGTDD